MNKYYAEEHKKLCDEMTKRYGAGWDRDKRAKNKIRDAAKRCARNLVIQQKPYPDDKVKEGKKTAEVFVN